ncbi:nose resistant to fluoxetine protein 6-like isoform X2 [Tubulanus polymorphus]|uniref:nose resistant to fluoxetine protein 6-like isoform X2 n=1 Tax=Tubulanus polymorphus TaxID=672921 RepID=UPI003DA3B8C8
MSFYESHSSFLLFICLIIGASTDDDTIPHLLERGSEEPGLPAALRRAVDELRNGTTKFNSSATCLTDIETMLGAWLHRKPWSLSMFDASGKPNSDNLITFGKYDQCRSVVINETDVSFDAQYCYSKFRLATTKVDVPLLYSYYGTCLPRRCSVYDTQNLVNTIVGNFGVNTTATPAHTTCKSKQKPKFSAGHWIVIFIFGSVGIFIAAATVYDLILRKRRREITDDPSDGVEMKLDTLETGNVVDETRIENVSNENSANAVKTNKTNPKSTIVGKDVILAFSAYSNLLKLVSLESSSETINCLHGIRFITMFWIILGHTFYSYFLFVPSENFVEFGTSLLKSKSFLIVYAAFFSVDTFFFLSGLVLTYISMKKMVDSGGPKNINWFMFYFHRFWRLTPLYTAVWMIYVTFDNHFGDGPLYPDYSSLEGAQCPYSSFLLHLAYINNLINSGCMGWTWFLAVDMQLHLISPLCLLAFFWRYGAGIAVALMFCLVNFVSVGIQSTQLRSSPSFSDFSYLHLIYTKPWSHLSPFMIGIMVGYLLYRTRDIKWNIHWFLVSIGPVDWLLSLKIFLPLSRLTYSTYLIHSIVIVAVYKSLKPAIFGNTITLVCYFLAFLCLAYAIALVASISFESPMIALEKVLCKDCHSCCCTRKTSCKSSLCCHSLQIDR